MNLALQQLTKDFEGPGGSTHRAVDNVSLEIGRGRFYTLLGPSGCGKTTLLRLVAGFEQPSGGVIVHEGVELNAVPPYRRGFPMVFQSYALFPHMTVADNVGYGLRVAKLPRQEAAARVDRALALLGLDTLRDRHPGRLSGGQQQRVALARCLVMEPEIILLDEPLSNLDAELRLEMRREIRALQQRLGITALYVTHDQEEAMAISDVVVVMNRGRIEQVGAPVDVFQRPATEFVARFMGCPNIVDVDRAADGAIHLLGESYPDAAAPATARRVVIRSDAIALSDAGRHRAVVANTAFLGSRVQLTLRSEREVELVADTPAVADGALASVGDAVRFDILPARLHYL